MDRLEIFALAISNLNGAFHDTESKAFSLKNPGLLKTYRPEKKTDEEHFRIFTTFMGGFKALIADLQAKCSGKNHRLTPDNVLKDMLVLYGFRTEVSQKKILSFIRRALKDDSIVLELPLSWLLNEEK